MRLLSRILLTLPLVLTQVVAQFDTATVLGTVRDRTDSIVPGAKISLTNVETGIGSTKETDENGNYEFFNVRIGRYKVTAEKAGFSTATVEEFPISVNTRQRVDLQLAVGQVSEVVEVTGAVSLVESDSSQRGQAITSQQIIELPLNGRQYSSLVLLTTGVRNSALRSDANASRTRSTARMWVRSVKTTTWPTGAPDRSRTGDEIHSRSRGDGSASRSSPRSVTS